MFELTNLKNIKLPKVPIVKNTATAHFQRSKSDKIYNVDTVIINQAQIHKRAVSAQVVRYPSGSTSLRGKQHLLFSHLCLLVQLIWTSFVQTLETMSPNDPLQEKSEWSSLKQSSLLVVLSGLESLSSTKTIQLNPSKHEHARTHNVCTIWATEGSWATPKLSAGPSGDPGNTEPKGGTESSINRLLFGNRAPNSPVCFLFLFFLCYLLDRCAHNLFLSWGYLPK